MPFEGNVGADYPHFPRSFLKYKSKRTQNWEEAKLLVNGAQDNKTYVLIADNFAGVALRSTADTVQKAVALSVSIC